MNPTIACLSFAAALSGEEVTIRVDLSALPETANKNIESWILADAEKALTARGHSVTVNAPHVIDIAVSWYGDDGIDTSVKIRLDAGEPKEIRCPQCSNEQWLTELEAEIADLAERLDKPTVTKSTAPDPVPPPLQSDHGEPQLDSASRPPPMTWLGGSGITLGLAGVGFIVAGSLDLTRGEQRSRRDNRQRQDTQDYRPRGTTFAVAGSIALAGGVTMLLVDIARQRSKRTKRTMTFQPYFAPTYSTLVLRGEF